MSATLTVPGRAIVERPTPPVGPVGVAAMSARAVRNADGQYHIELTRTGHPRAIWSAGREQVCTAAALLFVRGLPTVTVVGAL